MVERDPLEPLRDAWRGVDPPPPDADAGTDALVDELRAAWRAATADAAGADPAALRRALGRRRRLRLVRRACAAAAALLLAWFAFARFGDDGGVPRADEQLATGAADAATVDGSGDAASAGAPGGADGSSDGAPVAEPNAPAPAPDAPRLEPLPHDVRATPGADGGLELRRGRVRLLLGGGARAETTTTIDDEAADPAADEAR